MPGNLAELRPLAFIAAFVGMFVLIVGLMVTESPVMFAEQTPGIAHEGADSTNPSTMLAWNQSYVLNITDPNIDYPFEILSWNVLVRTLDYFGYWPFHYIRMCTYDRWWIFEYNIDWFEWYARNGTKVSVERAMHMATLDSFFAAGRELTFTLKNGRTTMTTTLTFNTSYSKPSDAFTAGQMYMIFGMDWNERNTSVDVLGFISQLFLFQLPNTPPIIAMILWMAMFPSIAYLTAIFILKIVGAIFGGG